MSSIKAAYAIRRIINTNKIWANKVQEIDPLFFKSMSERQFPYAMLFGCSDSRVPFNTLTASYPVIYGDSYY